MLSRILEPELMDSAEEATTYDRMDHAEVNQAFVRDLLAAASRLGIGWEQPPSQVLDLGTGTAQIPIELCRRNSHVQVLAVDAAASMLEVARQNVVAAGLGDRVVLELADAKSLSFGSRTWKTVMSNSLIHHIPRPVEAVTAAVAATTPGGLLFVRDLLRPATEQELQRLVQRHAAGATSEQQKLFADSLRAALSVDEMRALVGELDFAPDSVEQTSDRHWSWVATRPSDH